MKYRIALQEVGVFGYRHVHNIMLQSNDVDGVIKKIRYAIRQEIKKREKENEKAKQS